MSLITGRRLIRCIFIIIWSANSGIEHCIIDEGYILTYSICIHSNTHTHTHTHTHTQRRLRRLRRYGHSAFVS